MVPTIGFRKGGHILSAAGVLCSVAVLRRIAVHRAVVSLLIGSAFSVSLVGCSKASSDEAKTGARTLLNVSYDPTRGFYEAYNAWFAEKWQAETGERLSIEMSHGGSGRQARSVIDGLQADVVTLALAQDVDAIAELSGAMTADWAERLPNQSAPYTSTIVFVVRAGNPKNIRDWADLVREDVRIIAPNPKTSGAARWSFLAAWAYATGQLGANDADARDYVRALYARVEVLDAGARGASTTFSRNRLGDVLLNWENEAWMLQQEMPKEGFELVVPSVSVRAIPPVAVVDRVVDARGTRALAEAYVESLYVPFAQRLAAEHRYRPSDPEVLEEFDAYFPSLRLVTVEEIAGSWREAHERFFTDGGVFDQIYGQREGRER